MAPAALGQSGGKIRFGVGPLQPTPAETTKAYEPFFAYLAKQIDRDFELVATTDWAGISVALANDQVDLAWMGPWGYILANNDSGVTAIATAKYDGKPVLLRDRGVQAGPWQSRPGPTTRKGKRDPVRRCGLDLRVAHPVGSGSRRRGINPKEVLRVFGRRDPRGERDRGGVRRRWTAPRTSTGIAPR